MLLTEWNDEEAREVAIEEGIEIGLSKGRSAEKFESARRMKEKGYDANEIGSITGLPVSEIQAL